MRNRDVVVIGASSGGIEALIDLAGSLTAQLPAAVFVVQHIAADSPNYLPKMLASHCSIPTHSPEDGDVFQSGNIYVAPADRHLLIDREQIFLSRGPRENRVRPAIDALFRSAALSHGPRSIGVILSGSLDDGTAGLIELKKAGGLALVQDPREALTQSMPESALRHVNVDHVASASELGKLIGKLVQEQFSKSDEAQDDFAANGNGRDELKREVEIMRNESGKISVAVDKWGRPAAVSCPECGGPLWQVDDEFDRYRCHTGHAFTTRHLVAGLRDEEERALWVALRVMEERVRMLNRLAEKDEDRGYRRAHEAFADKAKEAEEHVRQIRHLLGSNANADQARNAF